MGSRARVSVVSYRTRRAFRLVGAAAYWVAVGSLILAGTFMLTAGLILRASGK